MNQTPPPSIPLSKKCDDCWALLPLTHFGRYRASKDGHTLKCKECRQQWSSLDYTSKHGRIRPYEPEVIRRVVLRNQLILDHIISKCSTATLIGWQPETNRVFTVEYSCDDLEGSFVRSTHNFTLYEDGILYRKYSLLEPDAVELKRQCDYFFRGLRIRLELTEADMIAAKTLIYFL